MTERCDKCQRRIHWWEAHTVAGKTVCKSCAPKAREAEDQQKKEQVLRGLQANQNAQWNFDAYKMFFDVSVKSREERTALNQYFLSLLFIQTLVAVLTAILGQSIPQLTPYAITLLTFVFVAAAVIAFAWFLKLWTLGKIIDAQQETLKDTENALHLPQVTAAFWYHLSSATYSSRSLRRVHKGICHVNYYVLPVALCVLFVALAIAPFSVLVAEFIIGTSVFVAAVLAVYKYFLPDKRAGT